MSSRLLISPERQAALAGFLQRSDLRPRVNEPLCNHCTWRIGGPADFLVEPASWQQVGTLLRYTRNNSIPAIVIGKGSNLLFDDAGLRGVVIKIGRKLSRITVSGTSVRAESGISAPRLARVTGLAGLSGLEHIVGIPGTLGGLVFMNGGSQRRAIGDAIVEVTTMDRQGNTQTLQHDECGFAYRRSGFQDEDCVITEATLELVPGQRDRIMADMLQILRERRKKFPLTLPNCGSVFKSVPKLYNTFGPPGKMIEGLGLKGFRIGGAMVDMKHANFIVNIGSAKAVDVLRVVRRIRELVREHLGVTVSCEAEYVDLHGSIHALEDAVAHAIP